MTTQITRQRYLLTTVSRQSPITCINTGWNIEMKISYRMRFRSKADLHFRYLTIKYTGKHVKLSESLLKIVTQLSINNVY